MSMCLVCFFVFLLCLFMSGFLRSEYAARRFNFCRRLRLRDYMLASMDLSGRCYTYEKMKDFLEYVGEAYLLEDVRK